MPRSSIDLLVHVPFEISVPLAPEGPFFDAAGNVSQAMIDEWLMWVAEELKTLERSPYGPGEDNYYFIAVRTRNHKSGKVGMACCFEYAERVEKEEVGEVTINPEDNDKPDNPLICKFFAVRKGWPEGPRLYLSDFRGDGVMLRYKLLDAVQLLNHRGPTPE